ncbi:MAG: glutamyl-tRNA reductase [Phocaeicola sp.]|nr:glutamyl-tRNA reductase [Phocaeicola sp.]MDY5940016.1 glutamyl-tRNA reductase [Phocaeicola sp.]
MIGLIGINHHTASVQDREKYALTEEEAIAIVQEWKAEEVVLGAVVLSTCNRVEIYYETAQQHFRPYILIRSLSRYKKIADIDENIFVCKHGTEMFRHLFRLSAGLDSIVKGETQILGQLKNAFRVATVAKQVTSTLSRLFHKAFETAKLIRTRHMVGAVPISSGGAAVRLLDSVLPNRECTALIVGAGQIAETIYQALKELDYRDIRLYNRTRQRAERFAETHGKLSVYAEEELPMALKEADIVFVATSSSTPIVTKENLHERENRPYLLFDMGVPRNVAEEISCKTWATVYTIDDLRSTESSFASQNLDWEAMDASIEEMVAEIEEWVNAASLREVFHVVQTASEMLLQKDLAKLPHQLTEAERALIIQYEKHLRVTFSTAIVAATRKVTKEGRNLIVADAIGQLFKEIIKENQ